ARLRAAGPDPPRAPRERSGDRRPRTGRRPGRTDGRHGQHAQEPLAPRAPPREINLRGLTGGPLRSKVLCVTKFEGDRDASEDLERIRALMERATEFS